MVYAPLKKKTNKHTLRLSAFSQPTHTPNCKNKRNFGVVIGRIQKLHIFGTEASDSVMDRWVRHNGSENDKNTFLSYGNDTGGVRSNTPLCYRIIMPRFVN